MILSAAILFILVIAYWIGYRGMSRSIGDSHLRRVLRKRVYGFALALAVVVSFTVMMFFKVFNAEFNTEHLLVMTSVIVVVLAMFSVLRMPTSVVTALWGVLLAVYSVQGRVANYPWLAVLLSVIVLPMFGVGMTWLFTHVFNRHVYQRKGHMLHNLVFTKRLAIVGVFLTAVTLAVNSALIFNVLLSDVITDLSEPYRLAAMVATVLVCAIGVATWKPHEQVQMHAMPQGLPALYSFAVTLLVANVLSLTLMLLMFPVILAANQLKAGNDMLQRGNTTRPLIKLLSIIVLTPLVAFALCAAMMTWVKSVLFTIVLTLFMLLTCLMLHLYFNQYKKHQRARQDLRDELEHKNVVGDEMNRNDMAAVTSQFDVMSKEIDLKQKELINLSLFIKQQRQYLEELSDRLNSISRENDPATMSEKIGVEAVRLREAIKLTDEMDQFYTQVEDMHKNFVSRLQMRCSNLSEREKRLAILLRLGFSSKEIAQLMNVAPKSVEINRYRFRRKLKLDHGVNMVQYLQLL